MAIAAAAPRARRRHRTRLTDRLAATQSWSAHIDVPGGALSAVITLSTSVHRATSTPGVDMGRSRAAPARYRGRVLGASFPIETSRLVLRPYEAGDLAFLYALFSREDVCRYLPWAPMDTGEARAKLDERLRQVHLETDGDALVLIAEESETGHTVGEFMLRLKSAASRQGEIGWSIHPDAQGRGLATEGAWAILDLGFGELGLHRIMARCDPRNAGSLRVMERLGMRREAQFVDSDYLKDEWVGEIVCAMLESEWRAHGDSMGGPRGRNERPHVP
jgi:RimJ/RimL family protein N-acetyltransferase